MSAPINPWIEPQAERIRDTKQTFIIKGEAVEDQILSRDYGYPIATLSLVDLTALARNGKLLFISYEPGYRSTLKAIPTLEVRNANTKEVGTSEPT